MKKQAIIYVEDNGVPSVLFPMDECLKDHTIQEIAIKDVPHGKKFKIVDEDTLPLDIPQEAWEIDESHLTDGIGGESYEFSQQSQPSPQHIYIPPINPSTITPPPTTST